MISLSKLIITILIAWLVLSWWRKQQNKKNQHSSPPVDVAEMVRCRVCGLHVPKVEALEKEGNYYCSHAHLEQDQ